MTTPPEFRRLFEQSPGVLLVLLPDANFTIVAATDARLRVTMSTREGTYGRPLFEAFPDNPADPAADGVKNLRASLERAMSSRAPDTMALQKYDIRRPAAEGGGFEERYWSPVNIPVFGPDGEVCYLIHQVEDATEMVRLAAAQQAAEARAEAQRQRLHAVFMQAPTAIAIVMGPRYVIELANPLMCRLWGRTREGLLGKELFEALPEAADQGFEQLLGGVMATGVPYVGRELPVRLARPEGGAIEEVYFNFVYEPLRDAEGRVEGITVVASDATEDVRRRRGLEAAAATRQRLSEERLRQALEASGTGTWELDLADDRMTADPRFRELAGLPPDVAITADVAVRIAPPEDRERLGRAVASALAGENDGRYAIEHRTVGLGDAPPRWVEARGRALFDDTGRAVRLLGTTVDIGARKAAEREREDLLAREAAVRADADALSEELRVNEAQLRVVTDALPVLVAFVTLDERYSLVNRAYEEWFGRPRDEIVGHKVRDVIGDAAYALMSPHIRRGLSGERFSFERKQVPYRSGGTRDVKGTFIPHRDKAGAVDGYVSLLEDVSAQRHLEEDRVRQAEFEQQLIGIVSHDLRNPLNAIHLSSNLLTRGEDLSERVTKGLVRIQNAAERATRLVNDLLDFTQARLGGGIHIEPVAADLHAITRGVLEEVEAAHPDREVRLSQAGDGGGEWDADRLAQVVQNLVTNALKYSPTSSPVRVTTGADGDAASLSVHNAGAPIPSEMLHRIFEPLQRGTHDTVRTGRSIGLGLYIVKSLVDAHGGTLTVRSTEPEGTTFTVRLPRTLRPR